MFKISNKYLLQIICYLVFTGLCTCSYAALDQWVIASGGNYTTSDNISLGHTIGQPFVPAQNSQFIAGFWHGQAEELLPVTLAFSDIPEVISTCENFEITVQVQAPEDQEVDTVDAFLSFDPTVLNVTKVKKGNTLTWELVNEIDNNKGHINFTASTLSPIVPKGTFDLMTITFKAKQQTTNTGLLFSTLKPRETNVLLGGKSIFGGAENIAFPVENAGSLSGVVSNFKNHPLRVHVAPPIPETLYEVITNELGQFRLTGQFEVDEEYTVYVSWTNALQKKKSVFVPNDCKTDHVFFGELQTGDVVGDNWTPPNNVINSFDVSIFRNYLFGQPIQADKIDYNLSGMVDVADSDPDFLNMHFDLNNDGAVGADDAAVFRDNLGSFGIDKVGGPFLKRGDRKTRSNLTVGESFKVTTEIDTNNQPVDVVEILLQFDPNLLQVNDIQPTNYLDTVLENKIDNHEGKIHFVAVQLLTEELPQGTFPLITVDFTLLGKGGEQTLVTKALAIHGGLALTDAVVNTVIRTDNTVTHTLTLTKQGSGTVTSDVGGIDCGVTCQADYPLGTTVMLTATPATDFKQWVGNCQGTTNPLIVNMDADKNCTAVFGTDLLVTLGDFSITPTANNTLLITWQTLSETDTLAFYLWRAQPTSEGLCADYLNTTDITRLTTDPIETQGSLESGNFYTYEIPNNLTDYCYGLEEIDSQGNRTFYIIGPGIDGWLPISHLGTDIDDGLPISR